MKQQRNTRQKQLVLRAVQARCDHPTAEQLFEDARACESTISRGTVYRNLSQLSDAGEINRIKVPGADRFDLRLDRHCHLICTVCLRVCDAPVAYDASADEALSQKTGYIISRHRTVFEGVCPECQKRASRDASQGGL